LTALAESDNQLLGIFGVVVGFSTFVLGAVGTQTPHSYVFIFGDLKIDG
jgi:hypothetical protein